VKQAYLEAEKKAEISPEDVEKLPDRPTTAWRKRWQIRILVQVQPLGPKLYYRKILLLARASAVAETSSKMNRVVTFGEIMMRLSTPGFQRFAQARSLDLTFGGGEANVAVTLANFGVPVDFVTRLPQNDLGDACVNYLRQFGVGTTKIVRGGERLGIYFLETGAVQRGSKVIYDRSGSSIATIEPGMIDWKTVFDGTTWFHVTGITPAISKSCADTALEAVTTAERMGLTVSLDLNYRAKLWKWGKPAREVMTDLVKCADIAIGNEEDAEKVFGIQAPGVDVVAGNVDPQDYRIVAEKLKAQFPNLDKVAITVRGSVSASHNTWSGVLYDGKVFYTGPVYDITHIVDRVGSGDAFAAGLVYGLLRYGEAAQKGLDFAVAAGCLKHTIPGDMNLVTVSEVKGVMSGIVSGRVSR
jgi:2-dehydro-3-deoxygluconokinase